MMLKARTLKTWMLALTMTLGTLGVLGQDAHAIPSGGVSLQLATPSFEQLRQQWNQALSSRQGADATLQRMEKEYLALTDQIAKLKAQGEEGSRLELEGRLRKAKTLATKLEALQARVQKIDNSLQSLSKSLISELDQERLRLERGLVLARDPQARASLVMELNAISQQRAEYVRQAQPREALAVNAILQDAQALEDPSDMLAMADELQDAEAQVNQKLAQIESGLGELRARRRLLRRAARFSREENFFEEGDRARVYATQRASEGSRRQNPASSPTTASDSEAPPRGQQAAEQPSPSPTVIESDVKSGGQGARGAAGADPDENMALTPNGPGNYAENDSPSLSDAPNRAPVAPEVAQPEDQQEPAPGAGDPFGGSSSVIVVEAQADPNVSTATAQRLNASSIDDKIRTLETTKKSLRKQARTLRQRAKKLRTRASKLD